MLAALCPQHSLLQSCGTGDLALLLSLLSEGQFPWQVGSLPNAGATGGSRGLPGSAGSPQHVVLERCPTVRGLQSLCWLYLRQ